MLRRQDNTEPLAQAEPIVIDLGNGLRFRLAGRIDRIDQIGPSSFEIIDYKTGGYFEADWKGTFSGGRRLQHALYGIAALELLKRKYRRPTIVRGVYYFSSVKGQQVADADRPSAHGGDHGRAVRSAGGDCLRHVRSRRRRVGMRMVRLRQLPVARKCSSGPRPSRTIRSSSLTGG